MINKSLKIAFVTSDWSPFFKITKRGSLRENMQSSALYTHMIALGLLKYFDTDIIALCDSGWQRRVHLECPYMGDAKTRVSYIKDLKSPVDNAYLANSVDWDKYDIVLSMDAVVPKKILKKHPKLLWLAMVHVPSYSFYVFNYVMPFFCYPVSLLDEVSSSDVLSKEQVRKYKKKGKLMVRFPLLFMKSGDIFSLSRIANTKSKKKGIHLERNSAALVSQKEIAFLEKKFSKPKSPFTVSCLVPKKDYIDVISSKKYFVVAKNEIRVLRGNALIEANSANCLILIHKGVSVVHNQIVSDDMIFDGFDELTEKISFYENNLLSYKKALTNQQMLIDRYCFEYPKSLLLDLFRLHKEGDIQTPWRIRISDYLLSVSYPLVWIILIPVYRLIYMIFAKCFKKDFVVVLSKLFNS